MFYVHKGKNNPFSVVLTEGGNPINDEVRAAITKVELMFRGMLIGSETPGAAIQWDTDTPGEMKLAIGMVEGLPVGKDRRAELILYSPDMPNGFVWADPLDKDACLLEIEVLEVK